MSAFPRLVAAVATLALVAGPVNAVDVDPKLPAYEQVSGISGNLSSIGSDTLNNLMTFWAEAFQAVYPSVNIQISGPGSSTAPPALIEGTAQFGPMSRQMKPGEIDQFEKKYGYKPTEIKVCIDALAVFVHKDNPVAGLTMTQVDAMFSSTAKRGGKSIATWGEAGLTGEWATKPLSIYGRNSASGTYGFFKELMLKGGDYKNTVKEQPGSSAVVAGVASETGGIGYSGIGYKTSGVRAIPLGEKPGAFAEPTHENCLNGSYPLARFLYVYVNKKPDAKLSPLVNEFIKFVISKQGQEIVVKDGYFPLTADIAAKVASQIEK